MGYWLFKSEPDEFGIHDLEQRPQKREMWNGVRNYQARNFLRDDVSVDDLVLFYHSSCKLVGIAGIAKVVQTGLTDNLQFDPESNYFDPKSKEENPRWVMVEIEHVETFDKVLPLKTIKEMPQITELGVVKKGQRLSIMPVIKEEFEILVDAARKG